MGAQPYAPPPPQPYFLLDEAPRVAPNEGADAGCLTPEDQPYDERFFSAVTIATMIEATMTMRPIGRM